MNEGGLASWLLKSGVNAKMENLHADGSYTHCFYDSIVFGKVKALLGGRVRIMLTGSAPIDRNVMETLKVCFCCPFLEGYGMTETGAGSVIQSVTEKELGHVGGPVANTKIRLRDIPDMGYSHQSNPPKGEVCFQGTSIMKGYFKNPEKTSETIINGWLMSGDVAEVRPDGSIKIVDRAKNIFKLSQGEYIAPEKLEGVYVQSQYVAQNWIYGTSLKDFIVIFIAPEEEKMKKWCQDNGKSMDTAREDEDFKMTVMKEIYALADANKFNTLEKPKQIHIMSEPFSVENDLLTPSFKTKRNVAAKVFADVIEGMYAKEPMKVGK